MEISRTPLNLRQITTVMLALSGKCDIGLLRAKEKSFGLETGKWWRVSKEQNRRRKPIESARRDKMKGHQTRRTRGGKTQKRRWKVSFRVANYLEEFLLWLREKRESCPFLFWIWNVRPKLAFRNTTELIATFSKPWGFPIGRGDHGKNDRRVLPINEVGTCEFVRADVPCVSFQTVIVEARVLSVGLWFFGNPLLYGFCDGFGQVALFTPEPLNGFEPKILF